MADESLDIFLASFGNPGDFAVRTAYDKEGDCIVFQVADEAYIADWIDDHLTLFRSALDERLIGWQIENAQQLIANVIRDRRAEQESEDDATDTVAIGRLLLAAYAAGNSDIDRQSSYGEVFSLFDPSVAVQIGAHGREGASTDDSIEVVSWNSSIWHEKTA